MSSLRRRLLAFGALLALGAGACAPTVTPAPSPTGAATAAPTSAASGASRPPETGEPGAVLSLPNSLLSAPYLEASAGATAYGSRGWELVRDQTTTLGGRLVVRDLTTADSKAVVTFDPARAVSQVTAGNGRIVWVEAWRDKPGAGASRTCPDAGQPLRWRIAAYLAETEAETTVATGSSSRLLYTGRCADILPPMIALDGDRLAFSVEAATAAAPLAQRVILRSLTSESDLATYPTSGPVEELRLSGDAVAWRENVDGKAGSLTFGRGQLVLVRGAGAAPLLIEGQAGPVALGGRRLAWVAKGTTPAAVWTMRIDTGEGFKIPMQLATAVTPADVAFVAAGEDLVAWGQGLQVAADCCARVLALWATGEPVARTIEGFGGPTAAWIKAGWLVWTTRHATPAWHDNPNRPDGFQAVRLEAIAPPWS